MKTWPDRVCGIEGSNGAGRPLEQRLFETGEHAVDVPPQLAARVRPFDTGHNRRTDSRDAHSIAVVGVRTKILRMLHRDGELEALRMLCDRREESAQLPACSSVRNRASALRLSAASLGNQARGNSERARGSAASSGSQRRSVSSSTRST